MTSYPSNLFRALSPVTHFGPVFRRSSFSADPIWSTTSRALTHLATLTTSLHSQRPICGFLSDLEVYASYHIPLEPILRSSRKSQSSRLQQVKYLSKTRTQLQANFTTTKSLPTATNRISIKLTTIHASSIDPHKRSSTDLVPVFLSTINRSITTLSFSQQ